MAVNPDVNLFGKLDMLFVADVAEPVTAEANIGSIEVALCGYGAQIPRVSGEAMLSLVTQPLAVNPASDNTPGEFEVYLFSNGIIEPPGTYYTVTVKDDNGDIVQVNAYVFTPGEFDLSTLTPFDPSQGPPNIAPIILDLLQIVTFDPAATFSGASYLSWQITLTADCSPQFTNLVNGELYTLIIIQDAVGGHLFNWPSNVYNATGWINPEPNGMTIQTFIALNNNLYSVGAATFWP